MQMHNSIRTTIGLVCALSASFSLSAVTLNVDSAPNAYGSPAWAPWWTDAKADVVAGTFINLRSASYPGTTSIDPYDEIVYSTGDLGRRLHWIYWLPGETISGLTGRFEVKWTIDWGGTAWTYASGGWALDAPDVGWSAPLNWEAYNGGVIGSLGFAWWASDGDALPNSTDGNPYNETNQADINALRSVVFLNQTYALGQIRYRDDAGSPWTNQSIRVTVPAQDATMPLLALGLLTLVIAGRKKGKD